VATRFIGNGRAPELLQYAGIDHQIPDLPSWAPDWTHQSRSIAHTQLYNCSGSSRPSLSLSEKEPDKLRARGIVVDIINWNAAPWRYYGIDRNQEQFARFKEAPDKGFPPFTDEDSRCLIRTMATRGATDYCSKTYPSEDILAAMARTLVMDCTWHGQRTGSDPSFLDSFNAFQRLYENGPDEDTPEDANIYQLGIFAWIRDFDAEEENNLREKSWPFEVALQEAHKGRRFCTTKEGYMCTTPFDTERGDVIVILEGFRMPFVLRQSGSDWKLVGDCYVHGIMDGELVVPLDGVEVGSDEMSTGANGKPFAMRTASGFAKFQEFSIV
jgi:hypothetical protein